MVDFPVSFCTTKDFFLNKQITVVTSLPVYNRYAYIQMIFAWVEHIFSNQATPIFHYFIIERQ
jgi:hypothetical protein